MAGSNDFTGQNIQDSYQRVLQLSSSGQLADGTGSLIPLLDVTASFATSADTASFATNFTASGNISASGNLEVSSSLTFGSGVAKIIGPGNNDFIQLSTDNVDIFIDGSETINIDNDSINLNASNQAINTAIKADDTTQLFFGDATNNVVRLNDHIIMSPGSGSSTVTNYTNRLLVSGSTHFTGSNSHITASGNISASGNIIGIINGGTF